MPAALDVDWRAIEQAAIAGVDYRTLAIQFGLTDSNGKPDSNAIRQRAFREQWPVPSRVKESARRKYVEACKQEHALKSPITDGESGDVTGVTRGGKRPISGEISTVTVSNDLLANGQRGTLVAQQALLRSLESLDRAGGEVPIASVSDIVAALKGVRLAAGMDSGDATKVTIGLFGAVANAVSQPDSVTDCLDVETVGDLPED